MDKVIKFLFWISLIIVCEKSIFTSQVVDVDDGRSDCIYLLRNTYLWTKNNSGSAGVAPEVNLRENVTRMPLPSVNKAAHSGFETQRRRQRKSKTGLSVAPQKRHMSSKCQNHGGMMSLPVVPCSFQGVCLWGGGSTFGGGEVPYIKVLPSRDFVGKR